MATGTDMLFADLTGTELLPTALEQEKREPKNIKHSVGPPSSPCLSHRSQPKGLGRSGMRMSRTSGIWFTPGMSAGPSIRTLSGMSMPSIWREKRPMAVLVDGRLGIPLSDFPH